MKFIIDAHLPIIFRDWLIDKGYDAIHTVDLPKKNLTEDIEIIRIAMKESRVIVTKDSDFLKYNIVNGIPEYILMITTGNIINKELFRLLEPNFESIIKQFKKGNKILELSNTLLLVHS